MSTTSFLPVAPARVFALFLPVILLASASVAQNVPRPDLAGVVRTTDGQPLSGASVFIYTAGPRMGPGTI
jgi:hypothetical protein